MHVPCTSSDSEFGRQVTLYNRLVEVGFIVRGDVKVKGSPINPNFLFDLIIYDEKKKAIAIIECKKYTSQFNADLMQKTKFKKYQKFDIPIFMCLKLSEVDELVDYIIEWFEQPIT